MYIHIYIDIIPCMYEYIYISIYITNLSTMGTVVDEDSPPHRPWIMACGGDSRGKTGRSVWIAVSLKWAIFIGKTRSKNHSGWWFGTWILFSPIVGMMIQSDFHIFQGGWNHQPDFQRSQFPVWDVWSFVTLNIPFIGFRWRNRCPGEPSGRRIWFRSNWDMEKYGRPIPIIDVLFPLRDPQS